MNQIGKRTQRLLYDFSFVFIVAQILVKMTILTIFQNYSIKLNHGNDVCILIKNGNKEEKILITINHNQKMTRIILRRQIKIHAENIRKLINKY